MTGSPSSPIRAVLFDAGGVLTTPLGPAMVAAAVAAGVDLHQVGPTLLHAFASSGDGDEPIHRLERGEITLDDLLRGMGEHEEQVRRLLDPASPGFGLRNLRRHDGMHQLLADVRATGRKVGVVSNVVREWQETWDAFTPADSDLDAKVLSWEVGARKPGAAIYRLAAERAGVAVEEVLFLDDFPVMVEGARAVGMQALLVSDHDDAIAEVRRILALP